MSLHKRYNIDQKGNEAMERNTQRKDNSISLRVSTSEKKVIKSGAKFDNANVTNWLVDLAHQRIAEQQKVKH